MGQPSGKFDYMVKYTAPESSKIPFEDIQPTGWADSFEYNSQPEEAYKPYPFEITEDLNFNAPAKVDKPEVVYSHINAIFEDNGEDGPEFNLESVSDNESLHPEDWELRPENPGYVPPEITCALQEVEEDRLSTTEDKVDKPEVSNSARPTVHVLTTDESQKSLPEYITCRGVRCYWKAVEVPNVVHRSK